MREGDYDEKSGSAYVWHDVAYALSVIEDEARVGNYEVGHEGWPAEAVIETSSDEHIAFLTVRKYPFPEDGGDRPPELSIYIDAEQAEHLRDWLDTRLQERKATHG